MISAVTFVTVFRLTKPIKVSLVTRSTRVTRYLTQDEDFINYGRGTPPPHTLPQEKLREVGLVQDTWQLEVHPDPDRNAQVSTTHAQTVSQIRKQQDQAGKGGRCITLL